MYGDDGFKPPVEVDEELDVKIEAVGAKGDGIAKKDGFVLFVPNTKEGETVRIRITKVLRKVGFADVIGEAQGPVEESAEEAPADAQEETQNEDASDAQEEAPTEGSAEDSEDFGEEEAPAEEEPAEEEKKE